jgi:hypothetical protein
MDANRVTVWPGQWVRDRTLDVEIDSLIFKLTKLEVEGIDDSVTAEAWTTVDDYIADDGGPLAISFDDALSLVERGVTEEDGEWEEPEDDGPHVEGDDEDDGGAEGLVEKAPCMGFDQAIRAARELESFLFDMGTTDQDVNMALAVNNIVVRLHELQVERKQQITIESFFPPQQATLGSAMDTSG